MNYTIGCTVVGIVIVIALIILIILIMTKKNEGYQDGECKLSPWSQWVVVEERDGKKIQERTRMTIMPPGGQNTCPPLIQQRVI